MAFYYVFPVLILFLYRPSGAPGPSHPWLGLASLLGTWLILVGALRVRALREAEQAVQVPPPAAPDRRADQLRGIQRHQSVLLFLVLVAWFVAVHVLRLPDLVLPFGRTLAAAAVEILLLLPFYALVLLVRWAAFPAIRSLRGVDVSVGEYLRFHLRAMAIFALPPLGYVLVFRWLLLRSSWFLALLLDHPGWLLVAAAILILALLAGAPILVRHLFPREPLDTFLARVGWSEPERERLRARTEALARKAGARLGPILVWRTGGMRIANAAVAGLVSRYQRIFVSDALLVRLGEDELMAVLAHELGHVRLRHPLLNYLLALSAIALLTLALSFIAPLVEGSGHESGILLPLVVLGLNALYLVTLLRFALNRFERQADALAAEAMGGAAPFVSALLGLVALNVTPAHQRSITHPSAARRVQALQELGDAGARARWLDRERWLNRGLVTAAIAVMAAAAIVLEL